MSSQTSTSSPTKPKDPTPSIDRVEDLATRILNGDILLPKFQRDFVWEKKQIAKVWDSVARGYPIGSILLWESRQKLASENKIADLDIKLAKPDYPVNYLLDGQQRLSSICGALFWNGTDPSSKWNIIYDLRSQKFEHITELGDPPLHQLRLNKLSDPAQYFKHVSTLDTLQAKDKQTLKDHAELLFNRFKNFKIATVTLGDISIRDVAPIFERINSEGTQLTIVDLMRAATWSEDFDLIDSIQSVQKDLKSKHFSKIDRKVVLRNLSAATGGGFSADSIDKLRDHTPQNLKAGVDAVRKSYKKSVDFLTTQIGIPSAQVLPYSNQLTVLAELFRQVPAPTAAQYAAVQRWFWRTAHKGYFGGWNTGQMSTDLEAVTQFAAGKQAEVLEDIYEPDVNLWREKQFRLNVAHAKLLAILLGHHSPVDLLTGQKIEVAKALAQENLKEFHHFFPRDYLAKTGISNSKANALSNIILLSASSNKQITNRAPSEYLVDVQKAAGNQLKTWLSKSLISDAAYQAAKADNYDLFLTERAKSLQEAMSKLAKW